MALLIQVLVPARAAGVLLTADPLRGDRSVAILEGVWGLGKTLVDGTATPDRWVVDKRSGEARSFVAGEKLRALAVVGDELRTVEVGPAERERPVLGTAEVAALTRLGAAVEELFGVPQDIEWALGEDGRIHLLQARPLTGLPRG